MTKARDLMSSPAHSCTDDTPLSEVARLMWEHDFGFVPIVERDSERIVGTVTDRDACMGAFMQGKPLASIRAGEVMNREVTSCPEDADLSAVHRAMRERQVRRMPIVRDGRLVGVISLNDLALHARNAGQREITEVERTIAAICEHRALQAAH